MVSWDAALGWRARRQFLEGPPAASAVDVVRRLQAVPAWLGDARFAVGVRLGVPDSVELAEAVAADQVVRVYANRGSTQFATPEAAAALLAVRAAGRQWALKSWVDFYGVAADEWPALRDEVRAAVAGGPLTRDELAAAMSSSRRFGHVAHAFVDSRDTFLKPFMWQGDLRFGADRGGAATVQDFTGVPGWQGVLDLDEAGRAVIVGYLSAYGPATGDNLQYWLGDGLSAGRARIARWVASLRSEGRVVELDVEGAPALALAEHADDIANATASGDVRFVPGFDQWVLGPGTADPNVISTARRASATRGANLVLVGGRVNGTWKPATHGVEVAWFDERGPAPVAALAQEAQRVLGDASVEVLAGAP